MQRCLVDGIGPAPEKNNRGECDSDRGTWRTSVLGVANRLPGAEDSVNTSEQRCGGQAQVTHGFPNLTYGDTTSVRSDPEAIVYHEPITETENANDSLLEMLVPAAG